jgi:hypothetical protein
MGILRGILKDLSYVVFLCFIMLTLGGIAFGEEEKKEVRPAKNLIDIECKQGEGTVEVKVVTDGSIVNYHVFELGEPNRLVVDIFGVGSLYSGQRVSIGHPLLKGIRIGVSTEKVRLVLDLPGRGGSPYEINKEGNGLVILLKEPSKREGRPGPALVAEPVPAPRLKPTSLEKEVTESPEEDALPADTWSSRILKSLDFSGYLTTKVANDLNKDNDAEDLFDFRNHLLLKLQFKLNDQVKLFASEQIKYLLFKNTDTDDNLESNFWEGYLDLSFQNFDFRIGKQIVRWGKTDELSPLDIINPQEYEEFVLPKLNDRNIPIFLAKINYYLGKYNLEGVFIPFFKASHIPSFNSDWAAFGHLKETAANSNLSPSIKNLINSAEVNEDNPPRTFENCSFGLRVLRTIGKFDLGLSYLYTRNTLPTVDSVLFKGEGYRSISSVDDLLGFFEGINPTSLNVTYQYRRMNVWGAEMETTWRNVGIRAELAYFNKMSFANRERSRVDKDFIHYVIGADYTWGEGLYTNLQFSQQIVANYEGLFWQKKITNAFNGTIRKEFMQGFLIPELYFYWNTSDGDYYLNPFVTYKYSDNISLIWGAYFLGGERDTLFGSFKDNDQIYFSAKFNF